MTVNKQFFREYVHDVNETVEQNVDYGLEDDIITYYKLIDLLENLKDNVDVGRTPPKGE